MAAQIVDAEGRPVQVRVTAGNGWALERVGDYWLERSHSWREGSSIQRLCTFYPAREDT